jgi:hypothetical protein
MNRKGKGGRTGEEKGREPPMLLLMREQNKISLNNQSINQSSHPTQTDSQPISPPNTIQHRENQSKQTNKLTETAPPKLFLLLLPLPWSVVSISSNRIES